VLPSRRQRPAFSQDQTDRLYRIRPARLWHTSRTCLRLQLLSSYLLLRQSHTGTTFHLRLSMEMRWIFSSKGDFGGPKRIRLGGEVAGPRMRRECRHPPRGWVVASGCFLRARRQGCHPVRTGGTSGFLPNDGVKLLYCCFFFFCSEAWLSTLLFSEQRETTSIPRPARPCQNKEGICLARGLQEFR